MRKFVLCLLAGCSVLFAGCLKNDTGCRYVDNNVIAPSSEEQAVLNYITANNIIAAKHGSNMYYEVITAGTSGTPNVCSKVEITYTGKLTNGTQFDSQQYKVFDLGALIEGMKEGLPLIQKGGRIKLYIPPSLGYGPNDIKNTSDVIIIPANSVLIFDVTLHGFQ